MDVFRNNAGKGGEMTLAYNVGDDKWCDVGDRRV